MNQFWYWPVKNTLESLISASTFSKEPLNIIEIVRYCIYRTFSAYIDFSTISSVITTFRAHIVVDALFLFLYWEFHCTIAFLLTFFTYILIGAILKCNEQINCTLVSRQKLKALETAYVDTHTTLTKCSKLPNKLQ